MSLSDPENIHHSKHSPKLSKLLLFYLVCLHLDETQILEHRIFVYSFVSEERKIFFIPILAIAWDFLENNVALMFLSPTPPLASSYYMGILLKNRENILS
jgi:hypothetical protein